MHLGPAAHAWFTPERPTLYVLDYADTLPERRLQTLLDALYRTAGERTSAVALLLLMRNLPEKGFVEALTSQVGEGAGRAVFIGDAVAPAFSEPTPIPELDREDLPVLFERSREAFLDLTGEKPEQDVSYPAEELPGRPLAVVLLALLAAYGHRVVQSDNEIAVFRSVWEWERGKWRRYLEQRDPSLPRAWREEALDLMEAALVVRTLGRLFRTLEDVAAFWKAHRPPKRRDSRGNVLDVSWLAHMLSSLFPASDGESVIPPIVPDPLADFVLAHRDDLKALVHATLPTADEIFAALRDRPRAQGPSMKRTLDDAFPELLKRSFFITGTVIPRLRENFVEQGNALARVVGVWLEETTRALHGKDPDLARAWLNLWSEFLPHPDRTVALREIVVSYHTARNMVAEDELGKAAALNDLGVALSALGRREEALGVTREAVEIYRQLAEKNPDAFRPGLAMSLHNLGFILSALGRMEEALKPTQEAVEIYRQLAEKNPDAFRPDLARSLGLEGFLLRELRRSREAALLLERALHILHPFLERYPQVFRDLGRWVLDVYLEACRKAGIAPRRDLVETMTRLIAEKA